MEYEPVIGLEVHAELQTAIEDVLRLPGGRFDLRRRPISPSARSARACRGRCRWSTSKAVEYALRVALALDCEIAHTSIFARKNYFYPDLPKGYQISQYEQPLAVNGRLAIHTSQGER